MTETFGASASRASAIARRSVARQARGVDQGIRIIGERIGEDRHALDSCDAERGDVIARTAAPS